MARGEMPGQVGVMGLGGGLFFTTPNRHRLVSLQLARSEKNTALYTRERRAGVVVNVTSSATLAPFPLVAVYTASKMAIEGFTTSLALELEDFNVRVKLVEPGYGPNTNFTKNSGSRVEGLIPPEYAAFAQRVFAGLAQPAAVTNESDVAEAVYRAVNDESRQIRFPAGADAVALAEAR